MNRAIPNNKRRLAILMRPGPGQPCGWRFVSAMRVPLSRSGWESAQIYAYRMDKIVFICDAVTGQNLSCGATTPRALAQFLEATDGLTRVRFDEFLKFAYNAGNYPPRPKV